MVDHGNVDFRTNILPCRGKLVYM